METRLLWASTVGFAVASLFLGVYEVQGERMPEWLETTLKIVIAVFLLISVSIVLDVGWKWLRPRLHSLGLRSPIYNKDRPNPHQWLLDKAQKQQESPTSYLVVTDRINMGFSRDAKRPMLRVQIEYRNLSVHDLQISQPEGYVFYQGERLPEPLPDAHGLNNVADGGQGMFRFDIYIPPEFRDAVCSEEDTGTREIRNLAFNGLVAKVWVHGDDSPVRWGLGAGDNMAIRPNQ